MQTASPAYYRSVDPVGNLVVRVTLRRVSGPTHQRRGGADGGSAVTQVAQGAGGAAAGHDDDLVQIVDVPWQQKLFGPQ